MRHGLILLPATVVLLVGTSTRAMAQEDANALPALDSSEFMKEAEGYVITTADAPNTPFELVPRPLLAWSNPERQTAAGAIFLYTRAGVPQAALCIYPNANRLDHEFQTLSTESLLARQNGVLRWAPQSGIEFETLDAESPPGATPFLRLRQMRTLSREFEAAITRPGQASIPLRLLPTPIYRYPADRLPAGIIDGAVFAFVQATDPEILLVVEARQDAQGERTWHYGLARMSMVRLSVRRGGGEVWKAEWAVQSPRTPYYTIGGN